MGSKVALIPSVHEMLQHHVRDVKILADLFAGTGTVASSMPNSVQVRASDVMECVLCVARARLLPMARDSAAASDSFEWVLSRAVAAAERVTKQSQACIAEEVLAMQSHARLLALIDEAEHVGSSPSVAARAAAVRDGGGHELVRLYFSRGYFSTTQSIALDCFRAVVDGRYTSESAVSWWDVCTTRDYLLAVWLSAASSMANSPGHTGNFGDSRNRPGGVLPERGRWTHGTLCGPLTDAWMA